VIRSWKNAATRKVAEGRAPNKFPGLDLERAELMLDALAVARSLEDLGRFRSVGLHKLKGDREGLWAMTINARWRLCFRFDDGDAFEVEVVDYHRG
jgi:proteic killer suppression protein